MEKVNFERVNQEVESVSSSMDYSSESGVYQIESSIEIINKTLKDKDNNNSSNSSITEPIQQSNGTSSISESQSSSHPTEKKDPDHIDMYLIEKVEAVYLHMKYETKYHKYLKTVFTIFAIISYSFIYNFLFMFATNRQNIYCYNTAFQQFELCSKEQLCKYHPIGVSHIIYDKSKISNTTHMNMEILNVNKKYKDFFFENSVDIFSMIAYDRYNTQGEFIKRFNVGVMLTEREQVNITLKYNDMCNYNTNLIIFGAFFLMGTMLGNAFLAICSDIFGRRKILILCLSICSLFCILLFFFVMTIDLMIEKMETDFAANQKTHYPGKYAEIIQQLYVNIETRQIFKNYKIILALFLFFISFFNTTAQNCTLSLLLENSINDGLVFKNFWIYNNGIILAVLYAYVSTYPFNEFKYSYLINGVFLLGILFFVIVYVQESPRQHFEFSEWVPFTQIFNKMLPENRFRISNLYVPQFVYEEIKKIEDQALEKRQITLRNSVMSSHKRNSVFEILQQHLIQIKESVKRGQNLILKREEVKRNPFIILTCLLYERTIRENNPIIWAFLLIVFFIFNITNSIFFARFFFTRDGLFAIYILNSSFFHVSLVFLFSNLVFYILIQFFGFKRIMSFCFFGVFLFSIIIDLPLTSLPSYLGDRNRYNFGLMYNYVSDKYGYPIRICMFFLSFFAYGIYYSTYMYIFKYTKTIYRSTFFGVTDMINKFTFFGAGLISLYFDRNILIAAIASILGVFTIMFLTDKEEDHNIICDKKKFEFNNTYK